LDDAEFVGGEPPTEIRFNLASDYSDNIYTLIKFNTGDVPGYRAADLIFGGELKASIGDSITSVLDKIKNKFTNFEYFYDLDGKFVF
jgi:hypothetical protein